MRNHYFIAFLFLASVLFLAPSAAKAQVNEDWVFVVFETNVTKQGVETSDAHPQERRFYVSNVVTIRSDDPSVSRNAKKTADDYFTAAVVDPMKAAGIVHQYYDDAIHINNSVVYRLDSRQEVTELHDKALQDLKDHGANIFTFSWDFENKKPSGLEAAHPVLYYRAPGAPLYEPGQAPKPPVKKTRN